MILEKSLIQRQVPALPRITKENWASTREELVRTMCEKEYGMPVPAPESLSFEEGEVTLKFCAGLGIQYTVTAHTVVCGKPFDFPFTVSLPIHTDGPVPFFVFSNFNRGNGEPYKYLPEEEIIDRGFAVLHVDYQAVATDDDDFTFGLAGCLYPDGGESRGLYDPGKIQMWAWANMRLMDYAMSCDKLDHKNGAVIGHSRLGKTALVTGMLDERFRYVVGNNSGCSGDAITRHKNASLVCSHLSADCRTESKAHCTKSAA